jgi:flagellar hook-associated protein 3 FlgL
MTAISLGDLAQTLLLRQSITATRSAIDAATADLSTGQTSDPGRHLGGHTARLSAIQSTLNRIDAQEAGLATARIRAEAMQTALGQIDSVTARVADTLLSASQSVLMPGLLAVGRQSLAALESTVASLNQRSMGQSIFAGTATDGPALAPAGDILAAASAATATAQSPADIARMLDDWLSDPAGFASVAGLGNADGVSVPIGDGKRIALDVTALDPGLRQTFKGLILGALLTEGRFATTPAGQGELARLSAESLLSAVPPRGEVSARLGLSQSRIEDAATRLSAENSALQRARNDLLSVDMYETSSRLTESETRLKALYALTARLSSLSLTGYMR